jgi:hypothetical protein
LKTNITSADQAAAALVPLVKGFPYAGQLASLIFALGIVGAGLLAVPTLAGSAAYATAEALGWRGGLSRTLRHAPGFYAAIAVSMGIGIALNLIGVNPIQALVYAAVLNGVVAVPLLALLLLISNNHTIMGEHTNSRLSNGVNLFATLTPGIIHSAGIVQGFVQLCACTPLAPVVCWEGVADCSGALPPTEPPVPGVAWLWDTSCTRNLHRVGLHTLLALPPSTYPSRVETFRDLSRPFETFRELVRWSFLDHLSITPGNQVRRGAPAVTGTCRWEHRLSQPDGWTDCPRFEWYQCRDKGREPPKTLGAGHCRSGPDQNS